MFTMAKNVACSLYREGAHSIDTIEKKREIKVPYSLVKQGLLQPNNNSAKNICGLRYQIAELMKEVIWPI